MNSVMFGCLVLACAVSAGRRGQYLTITTGDNEIEIHAGTPAQRLTIQLRAELAGLILADVFCGSRAPDCPLYCNDSDFIPIYCFPHCLPVTAHNRNLYCQHWVRSPFFSNSSTTLKRWGKEWWRRVGEFRPLYGEEVLDDFWILRVDQNWGIRNRTSCPQCTVILGKMMDKRLFGTTSGIFGLRAGAANPVEQLFAAGQIAHPIFTFALQQRVELPLRTEFEYRSIRMGALDGARCAGWQWFRTVQPDSWVLAADHAEFMGLDFRGVDGKILLALTFLNDYLTIPKTWADRLIAANIVQRADLVFFFDPSKHYNAKFQIGEQTLLFDRSLSQQAMHWESAANITALFVDPRNVHNNESISTVISIGTFFLSQYCLALDYERHLMGFGRRRRQPILWDP